MIKGAEEHLRFMQIMQMRVPVKTGWGFWLQMQKTPSSGFLLCAGLQSARVWLVCTITFEKLSHSGKSWRMQNIEEQHKSAHCFEQIQCWKQSLISFWVYCLINWCRYIWTTFYIFFSSRKCKIQQSILNMEIFLCVSISWVFSFLYFLYS